MAVDILDSERVQRMREGVSDSFHMVEQIAQLSKSAAQVLQAAMCNVLKTFASPEFSSKDTRAALVSLHHQLEATMLDAGETFPERAAIAFTKAFAVTMHHLLERLLTESNRHSATSARRATAEEPMLMDNDSIDAEEPIEAANSFHDIPNEEEEPSIASIPNPVAAQAEMLEDANSEESVPNRQLYISSKGTIKREQIMEPNEDDEAWDIEKMEDDTASSPLLPTIEENLVDSRALRPRMPYQQRVALSALTLRRASAGTEEQKDLKNTQEPVMPDDLPKAARDLQGEEDTEAIPAQSERRKSVPRGRIGGPGGSVLRRRKATPAPLRRRKRQMNGEKANDVDTPADESIAVDSSDEAKGAPTMREVRTCQICKEETSQPASHAVERHLEHPLFECPECKYGGPRAGNIRRHITNKHPSVVGCEPINNRKRFEADIRQLQERCFPKRHLHFGEQTKKAHRQLQCKICKAQVHEHGWRIHVYAKHLDLKLFECPLCDYASRSAWNKVTKHIKSMHEEKYGKVEPISREKEHEGEINAMIDRCFPGFKRSTVGFRRRRSMRSHHQREAMAAHDEKIDVLAPQEPPKKRRTRADHDDEEVKVE